MKREALTIILFWIFRAAFGQIESDNNWILTNFIHFQFDSNELKSEIIQHPDLGLKTHSFNTAESSTDGELLFHSSGCFIMDKNSYIMENGDSLNPGVLDYGYCSIGDAVWYQNVLIIPFPDSENKYILFTLDIGDPFPIEDTMYIPLVPLHLYYHIIDMDYNGGNGKVIQKNIIAMADTLSRGYIQGCRHANGRDWWIIIPEWHSNCYYSIYVGPKGVSVPIKNCTGPFFGDKDFGAQVSFSPNGNWFARTYAWGEDTLGRAELFKFDRCTGTLNHYASLDYPIELPYYTGVAFSPNSFYLYITSYKSLWQFDLMQQNIQNTIIKVGEIDEPLIGGKGSLYYQQLTPTGEIFIASPGNHYYLSSIYSPDKRGLDCKFEKYVMKYPENRSNYFGLPNYPNYRLGPIDGGQCDTLGLDNIPIAKFKYEIESGNQLVVNFTNLSYFEPNSYYWDFGDQSESNLSDPSHLFEDKIVYTVCLTASNQYGANTFCQNISFLSTSSDDINTPELFGLYPNPTQRNIYLNIPSRFSDELVLEIYNIFGIRLFKEDVRRGENQIDFQKFSPNIYYLFIKNKQGELQYSNSFVKN